MKTPSTIGTNISILLRDRDIKQKQLAEYLGVVDNTISYFCSGARKPNVEQMVEISKFFDVSVDMLLGIDNTARDEVREMFDAVGFSKESTYLLFDCKDRILVEAINFLCHQHLKARESEADSVLDVLALYLKSKK